MFSVLNHSFKDELKNIEDYLLLKSKEKVRYKKVDENSEISNINLDLLKCVNLILDYAMSVISITRALPDARDGLKPVQRVKHL